MRIILTENYFSPLADGDIAAEPARSALEVTVLAAGRYSGMVMMRRMVGEMVLCPGQFLMQSQN